MSQIPSQIKDTNRRKLVTLSLGLGAAGLTGCSTPQVSDYAAELPKLDLKSYFVSPAKFLFSFKREQIEGWCKRPSDLIDCYGKILPNLFERKKGFEPQTGNCPQEPPDVVTNRTTDGM